ATQHRRSPGSRETGASSGGRNPAEQHPIPIHPLGAPWPPPSIQGKMLIAISESRRPRRNSVRYPVNAGLSQSGDRPERTAESLRFETIPSSPILQARAKMVGPPVEHQARPRLPFAERELPHWVELLAD